jgi:hypothetical protein
MRSIEKRNRLEAKEVTIVTRFTARPYKMGLSRLKIRVSAVQDWNGPGSGWIDGDFDFTWF